jgi:hypothetical protein
VQYNPNVEIRLNGLPNSKVGSRRILDHVEAPKQVSLPNLGEK